MKRGLSPTNTSKKKWSLTKWAGIYGYGYMHQMLTRFSPVNIGVNKADKAETCQHLLHATMSFMEN